MIRSKQFHSKRSGQSGKKKNQPEIPEDVSKLRKIMRPLKFTILVSKFINLSEIRMFVNF